MQLFRVSFEEYEIGKSYQAENPTKYHLDSVSKGSGWINELLDKYKPTNYTPRVSSYYACDKVENCKAFIGTKRIDGKEPIFYKIEMDCESSGHPMVLTDVIRRLRQNHNRIAEVINEYWNPKQNWQYLEFLSDKMTIIDIINKPDIISFGIGRAHYEHDFKLANRLFLQT